MRGDSELMMILGVLSHDLGASLRQVSGLADAIEDVDALSEDSRRCFSMLVESAERGSLIIARLRDYRRAVELDVSMQECVGERLARSVSRASGLCVLPWAGAEELDGVCLDVRALEVIARELVRNAELFGASRIDVVIRREGASLLLDVRDDGIGIDERHHEAIFEFGRRLHPPHVYPGAGFGLAMVRVVCRERGWLAYVSESLPGEGSVFTLEVPLSREGAA